jgi:aryl-alcohol dehydrogenase-like predicted oxidoreductase
VPQLGTTDLDVFPLCLGGNVFGWTADRDASFAVLDAYVAAGGNFIDTADSYMQSVEGNTGGESETIIGDWMASRGNRDELVIATKVAKWRERPGLNPNNIARAAEDSLRRLQTDHIDLYYAHEDDTGVPFEDALGAFDALVRDGKVGHLGASNYDADRLAEALRVAGREQLTAFEALQPHYNLVERHDYEEHGLAAVAADHGLACVPYFALARGFLTGKYRPDAAPGDSPRASGARAYLDDARGPAVLAALDDIAGVRGVPVAAVALAWLVAQPTVASAIASARSPEQLAELLPMAELDLSADELDRLDAASE